MLENIIWLWRVWTYWEEIKVSNSALKWVRVGLTKKSFMEAWNVWARMLLGLFVRMFSIVESMLLRLLLKALISKSFKFK